MNANNKTPATFFAKDDRVRYIPGFAHGDANHPDCENGRVVSANRAHVYVIYDGKINPEPTDPEDLIKLVNGHARFEKGD